MWKVITNVTIYKTLATGEIFVGRRDDIYIAGPYRLCCHKIKVSTELYGCCKNYFGLSKQNVILCVGISVVSC